MGWNIYLTNLVTGGLLIIYTMSGGARAVAHTQKLQMLIVFVTLILVGYPSVRLLPGEKVSSMRYGKRAGREDEHHYQRRDGKWF